MEKEKGSISSRTPFNPYYKEREESRKPQPPIINHVILNFNEIGMNHLCTFHQEHYLERIFPQWINSMTLVINQLFDTQLTYPKAKEDQTNEQEEKNEETMMVLWD